MVTFRFYVVATVALFLALAVGIVVGSALNDTIVPSLKERIARVESNLDDSVAAIEQRKQEIDRLEQYARGVAPYAVQGRLADTSTVVVAEPGAAEEDVNDLLTNLNEARTAVDGVVWLETRWRLANSTDRSRLAAITSTPDSGSVATRRRAAWDAVMAELRRSVASPEPSENPGDVVTTTTAAPEGSGALTTPLLRALAAEGFVRIDANDGKVSGAEAPHEVMVVVVASMRSNLDADGAETTEIATSAAAATLPVVVAESYHPRDPKAARAQTLSKLRDEPHAGISTIDDLDLVAGRVGTVLALAELRTDRSGHYGYGDGAERVLPEWSAN